MEKIKRILLANRRRSNWIWAIGINLVFLISILLFCDIKYEVSDDFVMSTIISGAYGNGYNPHLMFINIIWGYLLLPFYHLAPGISWYLIAQLFVCFLSFTMVSYMLLERLERPTAFLFIVVLLTIFADDAYILVQFTKTAMVAVMGGGVVFLWLLFHEKFRPLLIGAGILCLAGTLIRFMTIYIAGGFFLIILAVEFWNLAKAREWKRGRRAVAWGAVLIVVAVGMKGADTWIYNQDQEYAFYMKYSDARASVTDTADYGYCAYEPELKKINISENDYDMMRSWSFGDEDVFSIEMLEKTGNIIKEFKKEIGISKEKVLENIQDRNIVSYPIALTCMAIFFFAIIFQRKRWILQLAVLVILTGYIIYFAVRERQIYRIEYSIFAGAFCSMLYFWENICGKHKVYFVEIKRICAILILICLLIQVLVYIPNRSYKNVTSQSRKAYIDEVFLDSWAYDAKKYRRVVNKGEKCTNLLAEIENNKQNFYLLDFNSTIQTLYYEWDPFYSVPEGFYSNCAYLGGVTTNYPEVVKNQKLYGIIEPLKDMTEENIYLIDSNQTSVLCKLEFIQKHYYSEAKAKLYKEIDGYQIWKFYKN